MIRKFGTSLIASTALAVVAVSGASLALASIPSITDDAAATAELHEADSGLPNAVGGVSLFDEGYGPVCYKETDVLSYFDRDRAEIGGEMVTLEAGFDQDFADAWRSETAMDAVKNPFKMFRIPNMFKIKTEGPMAPEIDLTKARKAVDVHEKIVEEQMSKIEAEKKPSKETAEAAA